MQKINGIRSNNLRVLKSFNIFFDNLYIVFFWGVGSLDKGPQDQQFKSILGKEIFMFDTFDMKF